MVTEALVSPADLVEFRGAPFQPSVVSGASGSVRSDCKWHVAPVVESTVKMRGGDSVLVLPTLRLVEVVSVTGSGGTVVTDFDWLPNGVLDRRGCFPRFVEVVFRHGFDECPPELLSVVAERAVSGAAGRVRQESLGSRSVSLESGYDSVSMSVIDRYRLGPRP